MNAKSVKIEDYHYELPADRIAYHAVEPRDSSKLLYYAQQNINDHTFRELPDLLPKPTLLVANNSKVIPARIVLKNENGAAIEILLLEPTQPKDYAQNFEFIGPGSCIWLCFIGNLSKWRQPNLKISLERIGEVCFEKLETIDNAHQVKISWESSFSFYDVLQGLGKVPLPPYIKREVSAYDEQRYQTTYSKVAGSVAAPTAGLHFTPEVLTELEKVHIKTEYISLHVGAGTFAPVKAKTMADHVMHSERFTVTQDTLENLIEAENITAVGTTTIRTLESLYHIAAQIKAGEQQPLFLPQWQGYNDAHKDIGDRANALQILLDYARKNNMQQLSCATQILIAPGYEIKMVDNLITNFHQPNSTLLLLIAAFIGDDWRKVYQHALANNYRFLSYGDSSLLCRV